MTDKNTDSYLVKRRPKVSTDSRGASVWDAPIESTELELVSTLMLKKILKSDDGKKNRDAIEKGASETGDGVVARDPQNGEFEIVSDDELKAILEDVQQMQPSSRPADVTLEPLAEDADVNELSLVSTQMLRKILVTNDDDPGRPDKPAEESSGGFDPYNSG